jgi:hypothetical protein
MAIKGASIHEVKTKRPLENQEANVTYWYHSWTMEGCWVKGEKFH